jgi:biotin carboxyl carrier protein
MNEINSDKIETISSTELKQKLDRLVVDIVEMLNDDIYRKTVIPLVTEWFYCNAPLVQLNEAIKYQVAALKPELIYKIEMKFDKFSKNIDAQLDSAFSGTADSIDTNALSDSLSESLTNILGLMTASIAAMISGGAGTAMIASGPAGLIIGAGLGAYLFSKGRKDIKDGLNDIVMNKNLPVAIKSFVKEKVMRELRAGEADFKQKIKKQLEKDLDPIYKEIKMLHESNNNQDEIICEEIINDYYVRKPAFSNNSSPTGIVYIKYSGMKDLPNSKVISWSVKEGDYVQVGDLLCLIAKHNISMKIISSANGYIYEILAEKGTIINAGRVLCTISSTAVKKERGFGLG